VTAECDGYVADAARRESLGASRAHDHDHAGGRRHSHRRVISRGCSARQRRSLQPCRRNPYLSDGSLSGRGEPPSCSACCNQRTKGRMRPSRRGRPQPQSRHYLARVHCRMEPPRRGKLQVEDRARRQQAQKHRVDPDRAQDLAGQKHVDGESCSLMAAEHQRADHRRNDEVDERIPGLAAAEVEPTGVEKQRQEMKRRAGQQRDGQQPESHRPSDSVRGFRFHRGSVRQDSLVNVSVRTTAASPSLGRSHRGSSRKYRGGHVLLDGRWALTAGQVPESASTRPNIRHGIVGVASRNRAPANVSFRQPCDVVSDMLLTQGRLMKVPR